MRQSLEKTLRSALERTVIKARDITEKAVREAIERLGVGESVAPGYLSAAETKLRVQLRAHGRHLGDAKFDNGEQEIDLLISESAYEHWHRMLFARFLEQNNLLMYDASTPVTLEECVDLAADEGFTSGWAYASQLASKILPQVFRQDSAVLKLELTLEHIRSLEKLIEKLDPQTFQAQDSLGWVYQFWQTKRKQEVNDSQVKIGAKELSPVTQLFTEPYMVSFLLDNALGAWWANRKLTANDIETAKTEQDLRERASLPGVPLTYLRFVQNTNESNEAGESESGIQRWQPAAGKFEQWPQHLSELKTLDPCCGSGHFLVAAFLMLVPMRMADEGLSAKEAVNMVLSQNIHGLELDQRCVELAAFALALEAWRYPGAGGYRVLPELHLACSGLSINAAKAEWKELGIKLNDEAGKKNLSIALDWMHKTFADAPVLGSLINPRKSDAAKIVQWDELESALNQALAINAEGESDEQHEAGIVAQGMAKAASLLAGKYCWVTTNVPFKETKQLDIVIQRHIEKFFLAGKVNLATAFLLRINDLLGQGGVVSAVTPHEWLFLKSYNKTREYLLNNNSWLSLVDLGEGAFESKQAAGAFTALITIEKTKSEKSQHYAGFNLVDTKKLDEKKDALVDLQFNYISQSKQLKNPDFRIGLFESSELPLLLEYAGSYVGLQNGDTPKFVYCFWEVNEIGKTWELFQLPCADSEFYTGRDGILRWEEGKGELQTSELAYIKGKEAWSKKGIAIRQTRTLPATIYNGDLYDQSSAAIVPYNATDYFPIWTFCSSPEFHDEVRKIDKKKNVTNATLVKIPFDLSYWRRESLIRYPKGLPRAYSNSALEWVYHGHPCGAVIWDEKTKWTAKGDLRVDDTVLQVATARLLGYQWPAELDPEMELADEQRQWVNACESLNTLMDDDGIACIPAIRGEKPAADRLEAMLQVSYGDAWNINVLNELLTSVKASSLEAWLRDKFFDQHCKMFGHRPFIWQIWDGLKDGFNVLVNYHQLDADNLDRLIYTYLGDWIRTQEQGVKVGIDGADIRLTAAQNLKTELEKIKQGEAAADGRSGYDIFVRWKPIHEQPIGWNPDLNDGVRLNIRPFMTAKDMGKKGAGILRSKPNISWEKSDRGTDVESSPWYNLGDQYGEKQGARINYHHLTLAEKKAARVVFEEEQNNNGLIDKSANVGGSEQGRLL